MPQLFIWLTFFSVSVFSASQFLLTSFLSVPPLCAPGQRKNYAGLFFPPLNHPILLHGFYRVPLIVVLALWHFESINCTAKFIYFPEIPSRARRAARFSVPWLLILIAMPLCRSYDWRARSRSFFFPGPMLPCRRKGKILFRPLHLSFFQASRDLIYFPIL